MNDLNINCRKRLVGRQPIVILLVELPFPFSFRTVFVISFFFDKRQEHKRNKALFSEFSSSC